MKKILFANYLALLFACDLPNVENPSLESINGEVIMKILIQMIYLTGILLMIPLWVGHLRQH